MAAPHGGYPPFTAARLSLRRALTAGGGAVGGRVVDGEPARLRDATSDVPITAWNGAEVQVGDWVSGRLVIGPDGSIRLDDVVVHTRRQPASPPAGSLEPIRRLEQVAAVRRAARMFFEAHGFLEVETPTRVVCPGLEPHLRAFPAGDERWLITSPELHLKRLLAAGAERLVEFSRAFRDDEVGRWHRPQFTLIEWYRSFAGPASLRADCEGLVEACARAVETPPSWAQAPFDRITVAGALERHAGVDRRALGDRHALAAAAVDAGQPVADDDDPDEIFHRIWTAAVEPQLGIERPVFVEDYPASQAALARLRDTPDGPVADRFELYIRGVEIANAFHELNDPAEQRRRHEADRAERGRLGAPVYPLDEPFLAALESGMPPAAGIALGLDRLTALLLGHDDLAALDPFSAE